LKSGLPCSWQFPKCPVVNKRFGIDAKSTSVANHYITTSFCYALSSDEPMSIGGVPGATRGSLTARRNRNSELGTMASYSLILYVMCSENVSYIVTLRQASVFLAVLVGWL